MAEVALLVNSRRYGGWKSVRITRSIESAAGSFNLEVSDRWAGQGEPWPIREEDECRVLIDGEVVIDGYVDKLDIDLDGAQRTLAVSGRDRTGELVDNSALIGKWAFRDATVADVARKLAEPLGIKVSVQPGLQLPKAPRKLVVNPGDGAFAVLQRAAQAAGVQLVSDGRGGLVITRVGTARAAVALVEGQNILRAHIGLDSSDRYHRYVVASQLAGTDEAHGTAARTSGEAIDDGVRRTHRVLVIRPEAGLSAADAKRRADWEARIRAARAETVVITVREWKQPGDVLWPLNVLVPVHSPAIRVSGELLITQAEHSLSDQGGELTVLNLVRPDVFLPEPRAVVKKSVGGRWKELD